jgi:hypothetical protein
MWVLLPWTVTDTQKKHIRKELARLFCVVIVLIKVRFLLNEFKLLLVKKAKVDVLILCLEMAAIACISK